MDVQETVPLADAAPVIDTVGEAQARYVATPASTEEVAATLRMAAERGMTVVPRGTGTKLEWGRPPERVDLLLDTSRLVGVVDHAAGDLVVRVRAGTPMASLAAALSPSRQRLALTTRLPTQDGTVGGTVAGTIAANPSSPLRYAYGTVRDILIGVTIVRADGTVAHAGGKVVKNVAGYDLGKLLAGSLGTLAVITEATFRLHPTPESTALVTTTVDDGAAAGRLATAIRHTQVVPAAVDVDAAGTGPVTLAVLVEGVAGGVPARAQRIAELLGGDASVREVDGPSTYPHWWFRPPTDAAGTSLRIAVAPSGAGPVIDAARALAARYGIDIACRGSIGAGVVHAGIPGGHDADPVADLTQELRGIAARHDGTVRVEHAAVAVHRALGRRGTDAFGPIPALGLMRRVKQQFDPGRVLSPGRFAGGI